MTESLPGNDQRGSGVVRLLGTLLIAQFNNAALAAGRLVVPLAALEMGASTMAVGILAALFTAVPMLTSVRFGRWTDRVGSLLPMYLCAMLIVGVVVIAIFLPGLAALGLAASLIGAAAVFSHIAATRTVGDLGSHLTRARNLGYLAVGYSVFQFLGPLLAGFAFEHRGPATAFAVIGLLATLGLVLLVTPLHHYRSWSHGSLDRPGTLGTAAFLRLADLRTWVIAYSAFAAALTLFPLVAALHSVNVGLSPSEASLLVGGVALGAAASRLCTSLLTRHVPSPAALAAALAIAAGAYVTLPMITGFVPLMALSSLLGFSLGIGQPIAMSLVYDAAPDGRINESLGLALAVTNFVQLAAPLTLGVAVTGLGIAPMLWALASVLGLNALMILLHRAR